MGNFELLCLTENNRVQTIKLPVPIYVRNIYFLRELCFFNSQSEDSSRDLLIQFSAETESAQEI